MASAAIHLNNRAKVQGFSARFVCFLGKALKDGRHPIMLQLIHQGKVKRISTAAACKADQWDKDSGRMNPRVKDAQITNGVLSEIATRTTEIIDSLVVMGSLNLETFESRLRQPRTSSDLIPFTEELANDFQTAGKLGNSAVYRNLTRVLKRFTVGKSMRFTDLTPRKLEQFEQQLRVEGCTNGGISVYMRTLRAVVSKAIKNGLMHPEQYPFDTHTRPGYSMERLKGKTQPRALSEADMDKVKAFPFADHPHLAESVRLFLFSYYARGMNFADLAQLKRSDIYDGRIVYTRKKTGGQFNIGLSKPLQEILAHFTHVEGSYLFPILNDRHATATAQWNRIKKCLKQTNADLKEAAKILGLDFLLTTYVARHTFASTLKKKGVDVALISESMGHKDISTTRAYLKRFENSVLDATDQLL